MLNKCIFIGRVTKDLELRYTKNEIANCSFTIAVKRRYSDDVDFIDVVTWRKLAENCALYLTKGKLCAVDGSLQIRSYEAKDGTKRKVAEIVADDVKFLSPKDSQPKQADIVDDEGDEFTDDLPF